ncbi:hypothetical protein HPB47_016307 [Ixodes persulcatus]|uniref:Uncharacterized protein n=1 Tax=Ixodes persulcatus TaxID=34615 RepID=A0AC60QSH7_IXOPE|nr:hypothetical protein HPB47_016307 [Ixodes persulcatus]
MALGSSDPNAAQRVDFTARFPMPVLYPAALPLGPRSSYRDWYLRYPYGFPLIFREELGRVATSSSILTRALNRRDRLLSATAYRANRGVVRNVRAHPLLPKDDPLYSSSLPSHRVMKLILNLTSGMGKDDDVALHVNPRFAESAIVRNSLKGGSWGEEERDGEMPLAIGQPFRLSVAVLEDCFRLTINDAHFADYAHRLSVGSVRNLVVEGDAVIHDVVVESQENELELGQADNWELYQPPEMPQEEALQEDQQVTELLAESQIHFEPKLEVIQPPKPVCQRIPEVMTPGRVVIVSGEVEPAAQRCTDVDDTADVGLHINPRFDTNPRGVVLNSRDRDQWQSEVQVTKKFPFAPGSPFELQIHCQEDKFRLIVNGCFLANFPHRIDLSRIDYICVDGSLIVDRVVFA